MFICREYHVKKTDTLKSSMNTQPELPKLSPLSQVTSRPSHSSQSEIHSEHFLLLYQTGSTRPQMLWLSLKITSRAWLLLSTAMPHYTQVQAAGVSLLHSTKCRLLTCCLTSDLPTVSWPHRARAMFISVNHTGSPSP